MKGWKTLVAMSLIGLSVLGCVEVEALDFSILFDEVKGLKKGDEVVWNMKEIGTVNHITYLETGKFKVDVKIMKDFETAVTDRTEFCIAFHPSIAGKRVIEMIQIEEGGKPIQKGSIIQGSTKISALMKKEKTGLDRWMDGLSSRINGLLGDIEELHESKEYQELKKELDQLARDLEKGGKEAADEIEKEILTRITEEIERFKERLEELGKEKETKELEEI
jgi:hypothetical protein